MSRMIFYYKGFGQKCPPMNVILMSPLTGTSCRIFAEVTGNRIVRIIKYQQGFFCVFGFFKGHSVPSLKSTHSANHRGNHSLKQCINIEFVSHIFCPKSMDLATKSHSNVRFHITLLLVSCFLISFDSSM